MFAAGRLLFSERGEWCMFNGAGRFACAVFLWSHIGEEEPGALFQMSEADQTFAVEYYFRNLIWGKGIGSVLLETAEAHCRAQGKTAVHVHLGGKEYFESYQFYPKHGYREYADRFMKKEL